MIEELRIRSLGVIEESVLGLGPGFTAITGETGAGKTMVVTALGLLRGGRADPGAVRSGSAEAEVYGVVALSDAIAGSVGAVVDEAGGVVEDGTVLLGRKVSAEGRSRAFAGGSPVPAAVLARLADQWVAVHGQSDQHRLLRPEAQRDALDRFAGSAVANLRERFSTAYAALRATEAAWAEVTAHARERRQEADMLRFGLGEIEQVAPRPGEDAELAADESRLGFAEELQAAAETARAVLSADDADRGPDVLGLISAARRALESVRAHDPEAAALADRVAESSYLLADLAADVASYSSGLESDPQRLAAVSERRAALTALTRKYGADLNEVLAWAESSAQRLHGLDDTDGEIERLAAHARDLRAGLAEVGAALSTARAEAALVLGQRITEELGQLAMPHARIVITVEQAADPTGLAVGDRTVRMSASGLDEVAFGLAANPGAEPRPLHKGASGGELSRVMLGLEVALADTDPVPTFVFDEVDAGVGGKAAVEVGRRLALLARRAQVIVVTHLPQVAAFADHHVVVTKTSDGRITRSGLAVLDDAGRVGELSRMLAGLEGSETAKAHAEELLSTARATLRGTMARP